MMRCILGSVMMVGVLTAAASGNAADAKAPAKLTADGLEKAWTGLARHDDDGCQEALGDMERMVQVPDLAVPFLGERLKPALAVDTSGISKHIADLDSNEFATRDRAYKALQGFGSKALPALEKKLQDKEISLEMQNSLKRLIQAANAGEGAGLSAGDLRTLRGIEVLREIGSPAARAILENLSKGDDGSAITVAAQNALKSLARK